ncbi:MAG: type IV pilus twitching motility protein PilT [Proteobacteria bacterium]|nr:type IV pilus twitching motility protein PilT [Pseudomonadota bacterium]
MAKLDAFFKLMVDQGASDLHLTSGSQPILRVSGDLQRVRYQALKNDDLKKMLYEIAPEYKIKQFEETGDVDFAYEIPGLARYRANYFMQKYGVAAVFRQIPDRILSIETLGLPAVLTRLALLPKGLVLVTGPTGSGKSTTLAAMVDFANRRRKDHILTVEDPVEFVHESKNCVVNHREVGLHTRSFAAALRAALREDPDIIMVGEMRDLETISLAVEAASTGHLVFGTLHTQSAAKTVDRIIDVFPTEQQEQIRATLADSLQAVVAQTLFKRCDRRGRCAALEILIANPAVRNLIRDNKTFQLTTVLQTGKKLGMQSLDDAIMDHLRGGRITANDAFVHSLDKTRFRPFLEPELERGAA